jgi:hypothetical protein
MRAGPLSSPEVIDLLNGAFVPVFAVNEDYRDDGPAPADDKAEYRRIYREALDAGLSAGTVHAYVVDPCSPRSRSEACSPPIRPGPAPHGTSGRMSRRPS